MKRPYRCTSAECQSRPSHIVHLDPENIANEVCPRCSQQELKRLRLVHWIRETPDGYINGSQFNKGKKFAHGCDYAAAKYKEHVPGKPVIASFGKKEVSCFDCLSFISQENFDGGCSFNEETKEFEFPTKVEMED